MNEAGASVYSASDEAKQEMPDVDISIRGAGMYFFRDICSHMLCVLVGRA